MLSVLGLALFSQRAFFIDAPRPRRLDDILRPNGVDWRVDDVALLSGGGKGRADFDILDPEDAALVPLLLLPAITDPSVAVVTVKTNLDVLGSLCSVPAFYSFAWEAGLLGLLPSPAPALFSFLFTHSPRYEFFYQAQLSALSLPPPARALLSAPHLPTTPEQQAAFDANANVIGVQLRGEGDGWDDPPGIQTDQQVLAALECAAAIASELGVPPAQTWVLIVTSNRHLLDAALDLSSRAGLNSSRMASARPPVVAHLDKSEVGAAAAAMEWVALENTLLSRCTALVASSGFGWTAGGYGGIPPARLLHAGACDPTQQALLW